MKFQYTPHKVAPYYALGWYTNNINYEGNNLAPHAATSRATFTPYTARPYMIEGIMIAVRRVTAPTTAGEFGAYVAFRDDNFVTSKLAFVGQIDDTPSSWYVQSFGLQKMVWNPDVITIYTYDLSTGGTTSYKVVVHGLVYIPAV